MFTLKKIIYLHVDKIKTLIAYNKTGKNKPKSLF